MVSKKLQFCDFPHKLTIEDKMQMVFNDAWAKALKFNRDNYIFIAKNIPKVSTRTDQIIE